MPIKRVVNCPLCYDGYEFNTNSGAFVYCKTCKGSGLLTPDNICYCGLSCNTTVGKFDTCGDSKCLEELQRIDKTQPFNTAWQTDPRFRGMPSGYFH